MTLLLLIAITLAVVLILDIGVATTSHPPRDPDEGELARGRQRPASASLRAALTPTKTLDSRVKHHQRRCALSTDRVQPSRLRCRAAGWKSERPTEPQPADPTRNTQRRRLFQVEVASAVTGNV